MRKNALNVVIFLFLAGAMFFLWQQMEKNMPKPAPKEDPTPEVVDDQKKKDEQAKKDKEKQPEVPKVEPKPQPKIEPVVQKKAPTPRLVALGDDSFYNRVLLTNIGGGVQQVVLPKFGQADRVGREVKQKDAEGNSTTTPVPLYLIPGVPQHRSKALREEYVVPPIGPGDVKDPSILAEPSYTIFHYPTIEAKRPESLMGEDEWEPAPGYGTKEAPKIKVLPTGEHEMAYEYKLEDSKYKFTKTYTLGPKDYHVSLKIKIERLPGAVKGQTPLRYQLSGPRGLPIEGEWYSTTYRNAIIGWKDKKEANRRQVEDAASIGAKRGGEERLGGEDTKFKYMVVTTQYFASGVAISDRWKEEGAAEQPWKWVRATTEIPLGDKQDPNLPYFDDITVRAASDVIDLDPSEPPVIHSYVIYNGPSKVRLLSLMPDDRAVDEATVARYKDGLTLSTITDFRSDNLLGRFASFIYWSDLVILFTNLMHELLAAIHSVVPHWALSIVILTIMVRLMLFYPSRKQTAMSMKMMEVQKKLQPEFEKLYEKYKDDLHTYNREKTKLMMQHGANPFAAMGGCLLLFAQMPIMMGLYFCLQESIFFRLDSFLWIDSLAAPDMLRWWSESIPYISTPEDIGSFIYLGPYFNLLPILAVGLMLYQQSKMMPPSTDPQAEQQRRMMKIMMIMMAFFFYKVAAGLALYFIVSTTWGIIERQFIPKPKINLGGDGSGTATTGTANQASTNGKPATHDDAVAAAKAKSKGLLGRLREALQKRLEEMQKRADDQSKRQIVNDPNRPGGNNSQQDDQNGNQGGNRSERRRKRKK